MTEPLQEVLRSLERFGAENDRATAERPRRMLNITRETGAFLALLVRATGARKVLEVGTSNGYSTLWLAEAARAGSGHVWTIERSEYKAALAAESFARAGLQPAITLLHEEAGPCLAGLADEAFDLVFLDSERTEYPGWWGDLQRVLRRGGLLVVDNATSHPGELAPFIALVEADPAFHTALVPVGNGEFLATRSAG